MAAPTALYDLHHDVRSGQLTVPTDLDLLVVLSGHMDAGRLARQMRVALVDHLRSQRVATFRTDELVDYRARRPRVSFDTRRFHDLTLPSIALDLQHDLLGHPFLLLAGPEPDFRWEGFTAAVLELAEDLEVRGLVFADAVPMPVPHTRRLGVTAHGTRAEVLEGLTTWSVEAELMAGASQMIEVRAEERGLPTAGYSLHIPHYVADARYPQGAVAAMEYAGAAMGRMLPTDELRDAVRDVEAELERQTSSSPEIQTMVEGLERNFDQNSGDQERSLLETSSGLPDGDELASAVEAYLQERVTRSDADTPDDATGWSQGAAGSDTSPDDDAEPNSPAQDADRRDSDTDTP
ncbi:MAG: PAC2 family protein [Micrococcus sp.]|nr:PAC2 family protein [Micrococcus sp.]